MKEERLYKATGGKRRLTIIIVLILIIAATLFTVNVLGDDQDGVDHLIKYSTDEIWALTYSALGVQPLSAKGAPSLENLATTLPLGASSDVIQSGSKELDQWINEQVEGSYLLDRIGEKDGCVALLVMNPDTYEASVISLNATEDFHTFAIEIIKPEPLSAEIHVYEMGLGFSEENQSPSTLPHVKREQDVDQGTTPPAPKGEELDATLNVPVSPEKGPAGESVDQGTPPPPSKDKEVSLSDFSDLLTVSSVPQHSLEGLLLPVNQEASAADVSDLEEEKRQEAAPAATEAEDTTTPSPSTPVEEGEESIQEKELDSDLEPPISQEADDFKALVQEQKEAPDTNPGVTKEEELGLREFHSLEMDQPQDGIIVTVPSNGVAIAKLRIGQRLEPLGDSVFQVASGEEFRLYSKDASNSAPYITWSKENYNIKYKIEEKTRLIFEGGGLGGTTLTLYNPNEVSLGQIIAHVDSLTIRKAATVPTTGLVKINAIGVANDSNKSALIGGNSLLVEGKVALSALSEAVGGSGVFVQRNLTLNGGAALEGIGESYGVSFGPVPELLSINGASLTGKTQPSRNNKSGTEWAGIYMPQGAVTLEGVFKLIGDATAATPVVPTPQTDLSNPRGIDEIRAQIKSYGLYLPSLESPKVVTAPSLSEITGLGGDVGGLVKNIVDLKSPVNINFTSSWVGFMSLGEVGTYFYTGGGKILVQGEGIDPDGTPFGYGMYAWEYVYLSRIYSARFPTLSDRYDSSRTTTLEAYGSQVGIYMDANRIDVTDASTLITRGGTDKTYNSDTPPPLVENSYGFFGKYTAWISTKYNSTAHIYSGNIGIGAKDNGQIIITAENSSTLKIIGSDTGAKGNGIHVAARYGSHLKSVGEFGGIDGLSRTSADGDSVFYAGEKDTFGPGKDTICVVEGIATNTNKYSGSVGIYLANTFGMVYGDAYILGVGDITGVCVGPIHLYRPSLDAGVRVVGVANPYLSYRNERKTVRGYTPGELPAVFFEFLEYKTALLGDNVEVIEVYNGAEGEYQFFGGDGYRGYYKQGLHGLNDHLTSSRYSMTTYNWSTLQYDWTGEDFKNNLSYPNTDVKNMGTHGLKAEQYPHNDQEFEFVRLQQNSPVFTSRLESAVSVRPLFESDSVTIIADSVSDPINVSRWEWGENLTPRADKDVNLQHVKHRVIFKNVPVYNEPKVDIGYSPTYHTGGTERPFKLEDLNYKVEIDFIPEGKGPADKEHFTFSKENANTALNRNPATIASLRMGEYWFTDKSVYIGSTKMETTPPPTIHFRLKMHEVNDGNPVPYRYPVIEILDGVDQGEDKLVTAGSPTLIDAERIIFGPTVTPPNPYGAGYDIEPSWHEIDLKVFFQTPGTEVTVKVRDLEEVDYLIGGKLHIEQYRSSDPTTLVHSETIEISKTPSPGENTFTVRNDNLYLLWFESTGGDKIYLNYNEFGLARQGEGLATAVPRPPSGRHRIDNDYVNKTAVLQLYLTLPHHAPPLTTVELFEDNSLGTTISGASYNITAVRKGFTKEVYNMNYPPNTGTVTINSLKPLHIYTLEQTATPGGYLPRPEKYQFEIIVPEKGDGTFDLGKWKIQPVAPVEDGWVGTEGQTLVIGNKKPPFMDYTVKVQTHGLWQPHGEENFFVQLTESGVTSPKVYYRLATFTKGATKESHIKTCPSFGGGNSGENPADCPSTQEVTVLFEAIKPGNYTLTLLPSERFVPGSTSVNKAVSLSVAHNQDTLTANGREERFFTAGAHGSYEFKLTP